MGCYSLLLGGEARKLSTCRSRRASAKVVQIATGERGKEKITDLGACREAVELGRQVVGGDKELSGRT